MIKTSKIFVIGLIVLFIGASATASISTTQTYTSRIKPIGMTQPSWFENFDTYSNGQMLDGTPDDGGWRGWDNDPAAGSYVTSDQFHSSPHSLEIVGPSDTIYEFQGWNGEGVYTSGMWNFTAWVYVPDEYEGEGDFIMLDYYYDGGGQEGNHWQVQMVFDSAGGVVEAQYDGWTLPLITGRWVEILVEIDLDNDYYWLWYDGVVLEDKEWTAGINNDMQGVLEIDCVDLWANGATSVYYDDLSLVPWGSQAVPDLSCSGFFNWTDVEAGATVTGDFKVANGGSPDSMLDWEVAENPSWGGWTFTPSSGDDLTPAAGLVTVQVSCVAPSETDQEFTGEIKVVNKEDPSDFCTIQVRLVTPKNKVVTNPLSFHILERLSEHFTLLARLVHQGI